MAEPIELLTLDDLARECFASRRTIEREVAAGRIRVVKIRRLTRVTRTEADRYKRAMERSDATGRATMRPVPTT